VRTHRVVGKDGKDASAARSEATWRQPGTKVSLFAWAPPTYAPGMTRFRFFAVTTALALAFAIALAQVDDRARSLLEGLAQTQGESVDTIDRAMVMTMHIEGSEHATRTRTVIDYVGRRAAIDMEIAPGLTTRIVMVDGQLRMMMGGMALPVPPGMGDQFAGIFDTTPESLLDDETTATYDGVVAYGGLVEGEQVTLVGATAFPGMERAAETRLVFGADGRLLAVVIDTDDGPMITVYDAPVAGNPFAGADATMYLLRDEGPELFATLRFEHVRINEPIEPGTFD
jgi:hypothetical protein